MKISTNVALKFTSGKYFREYHGAKCPLNNKQTMIYHVDWH